MPRDARGLLGLSSGKCRLQRATCNLYRYQNQKKIRLPVCEEEEEEGETNTCPDLCVPVPCAGCRRARRGSSTRCAKLQ